MITSTIFRYVEIHSSFERVNEINNFVKGTVRYFVINIVIKM